MVSKRTKYIVEVSGYHAGTHILEVVFVGDEAGRYVMGSPFGCSRTYQVGSDYEAVVHLLNEHGCRLVNYLKVGDVIKVAGYGYPMYIGELNNLSAVLYPAWHDEKGDWHAMTAGFRLHTALTGKEERVVQ